MYNDEPQYGGLIDKHLIWFIVGISILCILIMWLIK